MCFVAFCVLQNWRTVHPLSKKKELKSREWTAISMPNFVLSFICEMVMTM